VVWLCVGMGGSGWSSLGRVDMGDRGIGLACRCLTIPPRAWL
jgi:hypothetical protein